MFVIPDRIHYYKYVHNVQTTNNNGKTMTKETLNKSYTERCKLAAKCYEMFVLIAPEQSEWGIQITVANKYNVTKEDMLAQLEETPVEETPVEETPVEETETTNYTKEQLELANKYNLSLEELERALEEWRCYRDENPDNRYITFVDFLDPKYWEWLLG